MRPRETAIRVAVDDLHARGITPTSRNVLTFLNPGKTAKEYPNGMGGNDVRYLRKAMIEIGYWQTPTGRWKPPAPPELDEVICSDSGCVLRNLSHTLAEHVVWPLK